MYRARGAHAMGHTSRATATAPSTGAQGPQTPFHAPGARAEPEGGPTPSLVPREAERLTRKPLACFSKGPDMDFVNTL